MTSPHGFLITSSACALLMLGVSTAKAAGERLAFSGAVVEATCGIDSANLPTASYGNVSAARHVGCAGPAAANNQVSAARAYAVTVATLASTTSDPLLKYFGSYPNAAVGVAAGDQRLVTMTYE